MGLLIYILGMAWFCNLFCWGFSAEWFLKLKEKLNFKILNCTTCFSFYFSFLFSCFLFKNLLLILFLSFVISFVSKVMEDKYLRY